MKPLPKQKPIRLKGKAKYKFRLEVAGNAAFRCQTCRIYAPPAIDGSFDVFKCGHLSHIKSYGAGGGDTWDNVKWECFNCHINGGHGPKWSYGDPE